jgi:predicted transposase YdaD
MPAALDHDALFKLVLTAFFREFIDLVAPDLAAALDPAPPVFLDKESFADLFDPDRREADLVAQVRLRQHPATLLIHLEHQAQADAALDRRMFRYFARLYDRYDQPIYPIALCSYPRPRRPAADRHELRAAQRTVLTFQYQVVQLNRMDWRAYLTTTNPAAMALMARMRVAPEDRWRVKAACLRLLAGAPLTGAQRRLIGQFVDIYLPLNAREEQALAAEVARLPGAAKEVVMELITSWERKGRAEGLREGLREGRAEGLREGRAEGLREGQRLVVERMLTRRFGALPSGVRERLATLTADELTALADALLDFTSLAEVEAWLAASPPEQT